MPIIGSSVNVTPSWARTAATRTAKPSAMSTVPPSREAKARLGRTWPRRAALGLRLDSRTYHRATLTHHRTTRRVLYAAYCQRAWPQVWSRCRTPPGDGHLKLGCRR